MGRTPPIRRRALPQAQPQVQGQVHERARGETEAPEKETFPRRHPRLGSQFQTKIAKLHHPSDRPKPEYLSKEYPHLTEEEAHGKAKGSNDKVIAAATPLAACTSVEGGRMSTSRGGLLVHTPSEASERMDMFARFAQPLMTSLSGSPPCRVTDDVWKQHMIELHNRETPKKRSRAPRGGLKRKRVAEEEVLVRDLEGLIQSHRERHRYRGATGAGEDDAWVLDYLQTRHDGNVRAAQLNLMVELSAGRASKIRKCATKQRVKAKFKPPPPSCSESWRMVYERMAIPSVLSQFQEVSANSYCKAVPNVGENLYGGGCIILSPDSDDLKGAWRSILACGKSIESLLEGNTTDTKKLLLSTVVSFIGNAYGLPVPESCFGSQHVMIEEVSNCMLKILSHIDKAKNAQAKLRDLLHSGSGDGIDTDSLRKSLDSEGKNIAVRLDEADELYKFIDIVVEWEDRSAKLLGSDDDNNDIDKDRDDLRMSVRLAKEAQSHGYVSKALVQLNHRIHKAYSLRSRILAWQDASRKGETGTLKGVAALVRESHRLKFIFPEVRSLLEFHRSVEGWVDRANIAIRSRISLGEVKELISKGESIPLDLSDYTEKLKARVRTATTWIERLNSAVPCPREDSNKPRLLQWMLEMRRCLHDGLHGVLHELASDGNRIAVEVDAVKLLQIELDAKNWCQKARKWLPGSPDGRKGKLADIREHVGKALILREKVPLSEEDKNSWVLEGEDELNSIVRDADAWFENYKPFLEGDNRRNQRRGCLSIDKLRVIVEQACAIYANVGSAGSKIARILAQAEEWHEKHESLLIRCGLRGSAPSIPEASNVELLEMVRAVDSASSDISLDLDEALQLKLLVAKSEKWLEKVSIVAPKRSKRHGRASRCKFTVDDLACLLEEAAGIPVDTREEVGRLKSLLNSVETWTSQASRDLERIGMGFNQLRENINLACGLPSDFCIDRRFDDGDGECRDDRGGGGDSAETIEVDEVSAGNHQADESVSQTDTASTADSEAESIVPLEKHDLSVHRLIRELQKGARSSGIVTAEADVADLLELVSNWCVRSLKYLNSPREVFDKRYFGAFDRFVKEGQDLMKKSDTPRVHRGSSSCESLGRYWGGLLSDQLKRLEILKMERTKFGAWCQAATQLLVDEKKLTVEKLNEISEKSRNFPAVSDLVHKVRGLATKVSAWVARARQLLDSATRQPADEASSGGLAGPTKKLSMNDVKALIESGEKLKVNSQELKSLKASLRAVRSWSNKVKRCNLEQGSIHVNNVKELIREHESFLIEMPEELAKLKQATQSYCICRRPYDGFMIGCDECDEWYHGPCIGVSESRADRFDKYVCIRCTVKNVFKISAGSAVAIVKKWTSRKDLKKARQVEYQKHQRKIRKETKDVEKFKKESETLEKLSSADCTALGEKVGCPAEAAHEAQDVTVPIVLDAGTSTPSRADRAAGSHSSRAPPQEPSNHRRSQVNVKLEKLHVNSRQAEERLRLLNKQAAQRKEIESQEDEKADQLRRWCVRVRSFVLVPSTESQAETSRPLHDGGMSEPMQGLLRDAKSLGIGRLPDVEAMENCFKCMSWALFTLSIIKRKPALGELNAILNLASTAKLPDEKAVRTLKLMVQKASQWQGKVSKALAPKPGHSKPINVDMLSELLVAAEEHAVFIPDTHRLRVAIEDNGARHCFCGGPSDGGFMLCCDNCEVWFHGKCVNVGKDQSPNLKNWLCPSCVGEPCEPSASSSPDLASSHLQCHPTEADYGHDVSSHAPDPGTLWPPYPLFGTDKAMELLGKECSAILDDLVALSSDSHGVSPPSAQSSAVPGTGRSMGMQCSSVFAFPPQVVADNDGRATGGLHLLTSVAPTPSAIPSTQGTRSGKQTARTHTQKVTGIGHGNHSLFQGHPLTRGGTQQNDGDTQSFDAASDFEAVDPPASIRSSWRQGQNVVFGRGEAREMSNAPGGLSSHLAGGQALVNEIVSVAQCRPGVRMAVAQKVASSSIGSDPMSAGVAPNHVGLPPSILTISKTQADMNGVVASTVGGSRLGPADVGLGAVTRRANHSARSRTIPLSQSMTKRDCNLEPIVGGHLVTGATDIDNHRNGTWTSTQIKAHSTQPEDCCSSLNATDRNAFLEESVGEAEGDSLANKNNPLHVLPDMRVTLKEASA